MNSVCVAYFIGQSKSFYKIIDVAWLSFIFVGGGRSAEYIQDSSTAYYKQENNTVYDLLIYKETVDAKNSN